MIVYKNYYYNEFILAFLVINNNYYILIRYELFLLI